MRPTHSPTPSSLLCQVVAVNRIFGSLSCLGGAPAGKTASRSALASAPTSVAVEPVVFEAIEGVISDPVEALATSEAADSERQGSELRLAAARDQAGSTVLSAGLAASAALKISGPLSAEQLAPLSIRMGDFEAGLEKVQPSSKREGFATVPDVGWSDVGALGDLRQELLLAIVQPVLPQHRHPHRSSIPPCNSHTAPLVSPS